MSETEIAIPLLQTVSARMVLPIFGEKIIEFEAEGGTTDIRKDTIDEDLGISWRRDVLDKIIISYKREWDLTGTPKKLLDKSGIQEVIDHIEKRLPPVTVGKEEYPPDIAVSKVLIEVEDPDLAKIAGIVHPWCSGEHDTFLISWNNDPAEKRTGGQARSPLDEVHAKNRNLGVHKQGFKGRVLNCHEIVERARVYQPRSEREKEMGMSQLMTVAQWGGPDDHFPKFDANIGRHVYNTYLPDGFAELNYYYIDQRDTLQLDGWIMK